MTNGTDLVMCMHCGAILCLECDQVMEPYRRSDGAVSQRHERDDLKAPSCSAHRDELVAERRAQMRLIQGGRA